MKKYRFDIMNDRYVEIDTGKEVDGNVMDAAMNRSVKKEEKQKNISEQFKDLFGIK